MRDTKILTLTLITLLFLQVFSSCAINRVVYNEMIEIDGVLVKIVVLNSSDMKELVLSMQEPGHPIRERVFLINWMPEQFEIDDYNNDSLLDIKIRSTIDESHYFYGTEQAFINI